MLFTCFTLFSTDDPGLQEARNTFLCGVVQGVYGSNVGLSIGFVVGWLAMFGRLQSILQEKGSSAFLLNSMASFVGQAAGYAVSELCHYTP